MLTFYFARSAQPCRIVIRTLLYWPSQFKLLAVNAAAYDSNL